MAIPLHVAIAQANSVYAPLPGLSDLTNGINTIFGNVKTDVDMVYDNVELALNLPSQSLINASIAPVFVASVGNYCAQTQLAVNKFACYLNAAHLDCNSVNLATGALIINDAMHCSFVNP